MSKPASCFLHVPKSAGSALTRHLRTALGANRVFDVGESRYAQAPLAVLLSRFPVVAGHFTAAQIPAALYASTFFFTFLREPVDRVVSLYHFLRESDKDEARDVAFVKNHDLGGTLDALAAPGRPSVWANWQTFLFSGAPDCERPAEELLPTALQTLERFDFVGLHEAFGEGVARLGQMRGWPLAAAVPPYKVTGSRPQVADLDPALAARIRELNACDARLYARARELWERTKTAPVDLAPPAGQQTPAAAALAPVESGSREIVFTKISIRDARSGEEIAVEQGSRAEVELVLHSGIDARDVTVGIRISDEFGVEVYGVNTHLLGRPLSFEAGQSLTLAFTCDMRLAPGGYYLTVAVHAGEDHHHKSYHWIDHAAMFWCRRHGPAAFAGLVDLRADLRVVGDEHGRR